MDKQLNKASDLMAKGSFSKASKILNKVLSKLDPSKPTTELIDTYLALGYSLLEQRKLKESREIYEKLLQINLPPGQEFVVRLNASNVLVGLEEYQSAINVLIPAFELKPPPQDEVRIRLNLADAIICLGNMREAETSIDLALQIVDEPKLKIELLTRKAAVCLDDHRYEEAAKCCRDGFTLTQSRNDLLYFYRYLLESLASLGNDQEYQSAWQALESLNMSPEEEVEIRLGVAKFLALYVSDHDTAKKELARIFSLSPGKDHRLTAFHFLMHCHFELDEFDEAVELAPAILSEMPREDGRRNHVLLLYGCSLIEIGRPQDALKAFDQGLSNLTTKETYEALLSEKLQLLVDLSDVDGLKKQVRTILNFHDRVSMIEGIKSCLPKINFIPLDDDPTSTGPEESVVIFYTLFLVKERRIAEAIEIYELMISDIAPDRLSNLFARVFLGLCLVTNCQPEEALAVNSTVLASSSVPVFFSCITYYSQAWSLALLGNHDVALSSLESAIELDPDDPELRYMRGDLEAIKGNFEEAQRIFVELDGIYKYTYSRPPDLTASKALVAFYSGDREAAWPVVEKYLECNSNAVEDLLSLGMICVVGDKKDWAKIFLDRASSQLKHSQVKDCSINVPGFDNKQGLTFGRSKIVSITFYYHMICCLLSQKENDTNQVIEHNQLANQESKKHSICSHSTAWYFFQQCDLERAHQLLRDALKTSYEDEQAGPETQQIEDAMFEVRILSNPKMQQKVLQLPEIQANIEKLYEKFSRIAENTGLAGHPRSEMDNIIPLKSAQKMKGPYQYHYALEVIIASNKRTFRLPVRFNLIISKLFSKDDWRTKDGLRSQLTYHEIALLFEEGKLQKKNKSKREIDQDLAERSEEIEDKAKAIAQEFVRELRKYLKRKWGIANSTALIKCMGVDETYCLGDEWDIDEPVIYRSEPTLHKTDDLAKLDVIALKK